VRLKIDVPETGSNVGPSPPLNAVGGGGQLGIWKRKGSFEIDVNGGYYYGSMGTYVLDGYFLVKAGGIHQGVVSCSLMPVDEARVILSGTRIRHVNLKQK
jgi:hypothetical protein